MPPQSRLPDVPTLLRHVDQGMSRRDIGSMYGVTHQAVSAKLAGAVEKRMFRRDWPWQVQPQHKVKWLYNALTYYQITQKKERPLRDPERATMSKMLSTLESLGRLDGVEYVVDYDPDSAAGFYLRPRRDTDDPESILGQPAD